MELGPGLATPPPPYGTDGPGLQLETPKFPDLQRRIMPGGLYGDTDASAFFMASSRGGDASFHSWGTNTNFVIPQNPFFEDPLLICFRLGTVAIL